MLSTRFDVLLRSMAAKALSMHPGAGVPVVILCWACPVVTIRKACIAMAHGGNDAISSCSGGHTGSRYASWVKVSEAKCFVCFTVRRLVVGRAARQPPPVRAPEQGWLRHRAGQAER